jgi:hypothetical protein
METECSTRSEQVRLGLGEDEAASQLRGCIKIIGPASGDHEQTEEMQATAGGGGRGAARWVFGDKMSSSSLLQKESGTTDHMRM